MNVLTAYAWYKPTGMGLRMHRAMEVLAGNGHDVDWVGVSPPPVKSGQLHFHRLFDCREQPDHRKLLFWLKYHAAAIKACNKLVRSKSYTGFISFTVTAAFPLLGAVKRSGKPFVVFVRSNEIAENRIKGVTAPLQWLVNKASAKVIEAASTLVFVNQTLLDLYCTTYGPHLRKRSMVLYNDLPQVESTMIPGALTPTENKAPLAAVCGRLDKNKNISMVLHALATDKANAWHLLIIGDGPERIPLEALVHSLRLTDRVRFAGWSDNAPSMMAGADCFILPSYSEGVSNALLEALSLKKTCLVSDIPEHREIFPDGIDLFSPDDPDMLSSRLAALTAEETLKDRIKGACSHAEKMFPADWDNEIHRIVSDALNCTEGRSL